MVNQCKWGGCLYQAEDPYVLLKHTQDHVGFKRKKTFTGKCEWKDCYFTKDSRAKIKEHISSHFPCRPFSCTGCPSRFKNPRHLSKHVKEKHTAFIEPSFTEKAFNVKKKETIPVAAHLEKQYDILAPANVSILSQIYEYPTIQIRVPEWNPQVPVYIPIYRENMNELAVEKPQKKKEIEISDGDDLFSSFFE
eukprot:NODE_369_length_9975_cov_0.256582.p8 type:complete len:193 gc:universal NODE_369_length_9975_cov_0.256582:8132-8710(+)